MTKIIFDGQLVDERYYFYPQRSSEEIVNNAQPIGISDGENLIYSRTGERIISVQYHVYEEKLRNVERFLAKTFVLKRQATLIFSDEPDEVWDVVVNDKPTIVKNGAGISGVIEFLVPSGVSHSIKSTTVTPDTDGKIAVDYQGTYPAYPIITATMKSENGLVAFANDKGGVLQFGSPEEVDTVTKQKSDHALRVGYDNEPAGVVYNNMASSYPYYNGDNSKPNKQQGSFSYGIDPIGGSGAIPYFVNGSSGYWGGPSIYLPIKANSSGSNTGNFIMKTRFYFATSKGQVGRLEIVLQSGGDVAFSCVIRDSNRNVDEVIVEFWVKGQKLLQKSLDRKKFSNNMFREFKITKQGANVQFQLAAVTDIKTGNTTVVRDAIIKNWTLSDSNIAIDGFGFWCMRFQDTYHSVMNVTDTQFDWVNVPYIEDVPNRFDTGDVVTIDVASRKVYVNGVVDNTLQTVGNQWDMFKLEPGINTIKPVASSWATQFDTQLAYREAWL